MPTKTQSRAENDISKLEREVRDAKTALDDAVQPFLDSDGELDVSKIDARSPEYEKYEKAGKAHDEIRDQLHAALSVTRHFDRDAKSDELPERGKGVGDDHQGSDRSFKAAVERMHAAVDEITRASAKAAEDSVSMKDRGELDGATRFEKAMAEFMNGSTEDSVGMRFLGELVGAEGAKALITRGQGGLDNLVRAERHPLVDASPYESYTVLDLLASQVTNQNAFEYPTFLGRTGSAAIIPDPTGATTADATEKPDGGFTLGIVQERIRTLAFGMPVHRNSLDDIPQIRGIIEQQLPLGIRQLLQTQILSGNGTGENLLGVRNRSGRVTVARNAAGSETNVDAIHRTLTQQRLTGDEPSSILLNPVTFEGMRLSKNTAGDYYYGAPAIAGATTLWGKLVIQDPVIPATEALSVDWAKIILMVRAGLVTRASDSHKDFFMKNLVQFLCEGRFGLKVWRPSAIGQTTTLA